MLSGARSQLQAPVRKVESAIRGSGALMAGETGPSSSPAGPCAAPPDEQAGRSTPRKLFTSKAMSQLRSNLRATAGTPLFGQPKLGGQPSLLPKLTESLRLALKPKQEAARARPAQRPRAPSLKVPAVAASALAVVPEDSLPEAQAVPRPHHSLANLELLRTLGAGLALAAASMRPRLRCPDARDPCVPCRHGHVRARAPGALPRDGALPGAQGAEEGADPEPAPGAQRVQGEADPGVAAAPLHRSHVRPALRP